MNPPTTRYSGPVFHVFDRGSPDPFQREQPPAVEPGSYYDAGDPLPKYLYLDPALALDRFRERLEPSEPYIVCLATGYAEELPVLQVTTDRAKEQLAPEATWSNLVHGEARALRRLARMADEADVGALLLPERRSSRDRQLVVLSYARARGFFFDWEGVRIEIRRPPLALRLLRRARRAA